MPLNIVFPKRYRTTLNDENYSFYTEQCNGLQGAVVQYNANPARNTEANPFSFLKVHWALLNALQNTWDQQIYIPSEDEAKCLAYKDRVSRLGLEPGT